MLFDKLDRLYIATSLMLERNTVNSQHHVIFDVVTVKRKESWLHLYLTATYSTSCHGMLDQIKVSSDVKV